ncbi:MAG: DUF3048 domain-containing protein [Acidimicrobiaceae bacterium]|nr:DUF3048 domain-containing protein [Acidimicrobiaceae bacterium]
MRSSVRYALALAVVVLGVGIYALTKKSSPSKPATPSTTSTTKPAVPIAPLTGLPDPGGAALTRPALVVKIENDTNALPQFGIDQADVIYEEIVNGGITRLAAVFNQNAPAKIGPIRSVRPTDTQIVWPLGGIFAFSGGAPYAIASISTAPVKLVDESSAGAAMFRDPNRVAPYNLYGNTSQLFAFGGKPTPPPHLFTYRAANAPVPGVPVASVFVPFPSIYGELWTWNATLHGWVRSRPAFISGYGLHDITGTGAIEAPKNVIVQYVNYVNGVGSFTSYGDLQSGGVADIFTAGHEITGTWKRASKSSVIQYLDAQGHPIALTPGQTWVDLLNDGAALTVTH